MKISTACASSSNFQGEIPKLVDKHSHVKEEKEVYEESRLQAAKPSNESVDLTNSSGGNDIDAGYVAITKVCDNFEFYFIFCLV